MSLSTQFVSDGRREQTYSSSARIEFLPSYGKRDSDLANKQIRLQREIAVNSITVKVCGTFAVIKKLSVLVAKPTKSLCTVSKAVCYRFVSWDI